MITNRRLARWLLLGVLAISQAAYALATIEFMKMQPLDQAKVVKPIMLRFLSRGYKKVPDNEFTLIGAIEKLAYEKGYTYHNLDDVAEEAAVRLGMQKN